MNSVDRAPAAWPSLLLVRGPRAGARRPAAAARRGAARLAAAATALLLAFGGAAAAQAAAASARPIFVLNSLDATISVIDPQSFAEVKRIPTGKEPHHLYLAPDEKSLLVASALSDTLTLIDPSTAEVQRVIGGIADPYHLRFSPDMRWLVTASNRLDRIDIYRWEPQDLARPAKLAARIPAAKTPSHLAIDSRSSVVYATLQDSDELIAIDLQTHKPRWRLPTGRMPADVYLSPDDRLLLVGLTGDRHVEVYDVSQGQPRRISRIPTGAGAHAFRSVGDRRHVLVSNRVANTISKIDLETLTVVAEYPAPGGPDCMDLSADGRTLFVTSRWARRLTVIDTERRSVVRQVPVGRSPHGVWTLDHASRR